MPPLALEDFTSEADEGDVTVPTPSAPPTQDEETPESKELDGAEADAKK